MVQLKRSGKDGALIRDAPHDTYSKATLYLTESHDFTQFAEYKIFLVLLSKRYLGCT